jgi:outer membrane lipoprotein LolB
MTLRSWNGVRRAAATAAVLMLAACAAPLKDGAGTARGVYERTGRFAVNVEDAPEHRESVQGGFVWRDAANLLTLQLVNPFGSTLAEVRVGPGRAELIRGDGSRDYAEHPDDLVAQVLHSPVPVAGLRHWLRGRVDRERATAVVENAQSVVSSFEQDGWRVGLSRYDDQGPTLLQLSRRDGSRNIRIRLAVDAR